MSDGTILTVRDRGESRLWYGDLLPDEPPRKHVLYLSTIPVNENDAVVYSDATAEVTDEDNDINEEPIHYAHIDSITPE